MNVQTILSKSVSLLTVFAMTFNMAFAQTVDVEAPAAQEEIMEATEEMVTEPETSESEEEGGGIIEEVLGAFSFVQAPEEVVALPPPPTGPGSITVCKAIAKKVGDTVSIADPSEVPGYTFEIPWVEAPGTPGTEGFNVQPQIASNAVFTTDAFNPEKAFFGEVNDSDCTKFSNLPLGSYFYGEEKITGGDDSVTWTTKYSDQVLLPVDAFEDVDEYNDNLFTSGFNTTYGPGNKDADGNIFNTNADGHIVLNQSNAGRNRTIIVLNIFEEIPREEYCEVDDNLVVNGGFETPVVTNGSGWDIYNDGTSGLGWDVAWRSGLVGTPTIPKLELHRGVNGWVPEEGSQYAELDTDWGYANNEQASVVISQEIATIPGQYYELSYAYSPRPGTDYEDNIIRVYINGSHEDTQGFFLGGANTLWNTYTVGFTADSATTTIAFEDAGLPNSLGSFLDDVRVNCADEPAEPEITLVGQKIVCLREADLPNWGAGAANITSTTAADWVAHRPGCTLMKGWEFEWAYYNTPNPGDNDTGPTGGDWNLFNSYTNVPMPSDTADDTKLWVREVLPEGYIPFTGANTTENVSAEIYCHTDVLHYDNYERIDDLVEGGTYNCVAWNVEVQDDEPSCEETQSCEEEEITICHVNEGNGNDNTLTLPMSGAQNHLENHEGDYEGVCEGDDNDDDNNDQPNNNNSGSNSSGSQRRSGGSVAGASTGDVLGACVPFTEYHRKGDTGGEVARIQEFLNEHMNAGLTVDGVYGDTTVKAVHTFQQKYFEQIIRPWVPSFMARTTGKWYKTTRMMANELIVCPESEVYLEDPKVMYKVKWEAAVKQD